MTHIDSISRRFVLLLAGAGLALSACGNGGTETAAPANGASGEYTVADDYVLGKADAPVTLVEYASVACSHCADWHKGVYPTVKSEYIDTGKVKYVFRPFPAGPPEMAQAGHMLALCADRNKFYKNIGLQFERQAQIFDMGRKPNGLRQAYVSLAKASGLSEDEFIACMGNTEVQDRYKDYIQLGQDQGVTGTPSIFINGERVDSDLKSVTTAIATQLGEPIPEDEDTSE